MLKFLALLAIAGALLAPQPLFAQSSRPVRTAPANVESGTLVSIPGHPVRIPLSAPEDFPHDDAVWVPAASRVRLVPLAGQQFDDQPIAEIIGFTPAEVIQTRDPGWLAPAIRWETLRPGDVTVAPNAPVYWMLFVRLPDSFDAPQWRTPQNGRDQALTLEIGSERFPLRLAPSPANLPSGRIPVLDGETEQWRTLGERLAPAAADPTRRWRIALLLDRLPAARLFNVSTLDERFPLTDPIFRGLADTLESEWRSALSDLATDDAELAAELLACLTAVVRLPSGELLPAWPTDALAESQLLPGLLSRSLSRAERVESVRRYLDARPNIRVTVIDDAGQQLITEVNQRFRSGGEAAEQILTSRASTLFVTNLSFHERPVTLGPPGEFGSEVLRLSPFASRRTEFDPSVVRPVTTSPDDDSSPVTGGLAIRDEGRESRVEFRVAPGSIRRPGRQLGPGLEPWSLVSWNADAVRSTPLDRQTALFLYKEDRTGRWKLLVEAKTPIEDSDSRSGAVTVYLGPFGQSDAVIRLSPADAGVTHSADRWATIIDIPEAVLARVRREGTLAIGFVRSDEQRPTSSWPRPLLPGQTEPGRVRLDLSGWGSI